MKSKLHTHSLSLSHLFDHYNPVQDEHRSSQLIFWLLHYNEANNHINAALRKIDRLCSLRGRGFKGAMVAVVRGALMYISAGESLPLPLSLSCRFTWVWPTQGHLQLSSNVFSSTLRWVIKACRATGVKLEMISGSGRQRACVRKMSVELNLNCASYKGSIRVF